MKRIIAILIVLSCIFALAACNKDKNEGNKPENSMSVAEVQAKIDASVPAGAKVTVTLASALGDLNGSYNIVYNEDGTATVEYSYELFNPFVEGSFSTDIKSTYTGTTTVAGDGTVTDEIGGVASIQAITFAVKLDESKLDGVSVAANALHAKVKAADTESVLGVAFESDVDLIVTVGSKGVTSIAFSYNSSAGSVEVITTYSYPLPEEEETEEGAQDETAVDGAEESVE